MRLDERKRAAQIAVDLSRKQDGAVIIHVGALNSRDAMELTEHAAEVFNAFDEFCLPELLYGDHGHRLAADSCMAEDAIILGSSIRVTAHSAV